MKSTPLIEVAAVFLKLGAVGFGGPAAHLAMMEEEIVGRRRWLPRERFLDIVGVTNLIPGPNSTEVAIHLGHLRAGWPGLVVAGLAFIAPAVAITAALAWAYVRFGALPAVSPWLAGIKPAVVGIITAAAWRLGRVAARDWRLVALGAAVAAAALLRAGEIVALLAGGVIGMVWLQAGNRRPVVSPVVWVPFALIGVRVAAEAVAPDAAIRVTGVPLADVAVFFLKVGSVLYGSGYVLVALIEPLVRDQGWLTQRQLLDAVAIGQLTPGPVLSTATFIGYVVSGGWGAVLATMAIFLPSFVFVAGLTRVMGSLRRSRWTAAFVDAVNVSAVALMAAVVVTLGRAALTDGCSWILAAGATALSLRGGVGAAWIVAGAGVASWAVSCLRWLA